MAHHKRKKLLVNRAQYRLLGFNLLYYFVFVASISVALWGPLILGLNSQETSESERAEMASLFLYLHSRVLPVAAILACALTVHSVIVSHRIVGPLVRFRATYKRIGAGYLGDRIRLRKRDYLHAEAADLNTMIQELSARLRGVDTRFADLHQEWFTLSNELRRNDGNAADADLQRIERCFADYREAWQAFEFDAKKNESTPTGVLDEQTAINPDWRVVNQGQQAQAGLLPLGRGRIDDQQS